jgi:hypothetical protein
MSTKQPTDPRAFTPSMGLSIPLPAPEDEEEARRRKKERKAYEAATQPLDPWQRYKALTDVLDAEQDLVDLADHKARFALIIMGALNAGVFFSSARAPAGTLTGDGLGKLVGIGVLIYAASALYFFVQAIEALRPRGKASNRPLPREPLPDLALGMRFYPDILERTREQYQELWNSLRVDNLNAELCQQVHAVARINKEKYAALRRLYVGLKTLTVQAAIVLLGLLLVLRF